MKGKNIILYFTLVLFFTTSNINAQVFKGGLLAGFNASQIRGDNLSGFDKLGMNVGITAMYPLSERVDLELALLYSQRGSQQEIVHDNSIHLQYVLNYASVPIMISYKDWYIEDGDFYRMRFMFGLSFGRLLFSSINGYKKGENADVDQIMDAYRSNDLSWIIGMGYYFNDRVGMIGKYNRSFAPILDSSKHPDAFSNDLLSFYLTFQLVYLL